MRENKMQTQLFKILKENYKKSKVNEEFPLMHGTADLMVLHNNKTYCFEIKEVPTKKLFEQALRHKLFSDKIYCVATRPANKATEAKWTSYSKELGINVVWHDEIDTFKLWKGKKNKKVNRKIRRLTYGI